jgi:hypothetical protein
LACWSAELIKKFAFKFVCAPAITARFANPASIFGNNFDLGFTRKTHKIDNARLEDCAIGVIARHKKKLFLVKGKGLDQPKPFVGLRVVFESLILSFLTKRLACLMVIPGLPLVIPWPMSFAPRPGMRMPSTPVDP